MYTKDTVRLVVQFRDFDGKSINPDDVKLTIYDLDEQVIEEITDGIIDNGQGNYHYDFITTDSDFIYEFSSFYFEKPVLAREKVQVKFI